MAGLLLLVSLVAAPWMYGSTRHWAIVRLCELLSVTTVCWLCALLLQRRKPRVPALLSWTVGFLTVSGWLVTLAGPPLPPDPFAVEHLQALLRSAPGSFVIKTPVESMWLFSSLFGALLVTIDLASDRRWWRAIYVVIALVGVSIVLLGLVQILTGAREILWQPDVPNAGYFFATYFHHSLGGAFINLVWPLLAGLLLDHARQAWEGKWWHSAAALIWGLFLLVTLCGLLAQLSRFAQFNALLLLAGWLSWLIWRGRKRILGKLLCGFLLIGILMGPVVGASAVRLGKLPEIVGRWGLLLRPQPVTPPPDLPVDFRIRPDGFIPSPQTGGFLGDRGVAATTCLKMIPKGGFLGFGPGGWAAAYPHFTDDPFVRTFFLYLQFAHSDWLQTIVEWGLLGALGWALLVVGGIRQILRRLRWSKRTKTDLGSREILTTALLISLTGVLLHGLIDFPLQIPSLQLYFLVLFGLAWKSVPFTFGAAKRSVRT